MPGGRLTFEERGLIAEGLREGLGYAEIARRLQRPTSTVSREVGRNGGRSAYRPEQAQRASRERARRAGPVASRRSPGGGPGRDEAVRDFERRFAEMMIETGATSMMARVLVSLLLSEARGLTAADLVGRLGVSPASVSKMVRYLEQLGMLRRERLPGERRERYVIDEDMWARMWRARAEAVGLWVGLCQEGVEVVGSGTSAGRRLALAAEFFDAVRRSMLQACEEWVRLHPGR
ncbi:GbsR/MarR family transcriptional regulator [Thermoactinospora rubra]|uniref:GbsR/MarR family transcriptional regulator n=1 Tax=Thermoactinospora rubra TaxID=1088767 RepID=UPI000A1184F2|nr:helix-turn-helix domain-containing protein [Thermoactinospora rubra]